MESNTSQIGSCVIEGEIGRGGMGVVYLGRDTVLNRQVAIKTLPEAFASNPDRVGRFLREAKALASLNHPNIAAIYGLEDIDGAKHLILEYVEGETLGDRLKRGALPLDDVIEIGSQIASGMEAAHEAGIIHRDLKPANVKLTPNGDVKILDFGLAKTTGIGPSSDPNLPNTPTLSREDTALGTILGTVGYMSPEQARGKRVDRRTDLWAFGCMIFEMLTGHQAFRGETHTDTIAQILHGDPEWGLLPPETPTGIRRLLHRCLEKDVRKRLHDAADARLDLEEPMTGPGLVAPPPRAVPRSRRLALAAALVLVGAVAGAVAWSWTRPRAIETSAGRRTVRLTLSQPANLDIKDGVASPTGDILAFVAVPKGARADAKPQSMIYTRRMDSYDSVPLPGTEEAIQIQFSPDGKWIAFLSQPLQTFPRTRLAKVPVDGSSPALTIAEWPDFVALSAWLPGGDILMMDKQGASVTRVPADGSTPKPPLKVQLGKFLGAFVRPRVLAGDRSALIDAVYYGPRGFQCGVGILDLVNGQIRLLIEEGGHARYADSRQILFARGSTLLAAPFDPATEKLLGSPVAVLSGLRTQSTWWPADFTLSGPSDLIYEAGKPATGRNQLAVVDSEGAVKAWSDERKNFGGQIAISERGRRLATVITNADAIDEVWVSDLDRPSLRKVAAISNCDLDYPTWSPDGSRLAVERTGRTDEDGVYWMNADGSGSPTLILRAEGETASYMPLDWTPDSSSILLLKVTADKSFIVVAPVPASGGRMAEPRVLLSAEYANVDATFSPDGRLLAYASRESGPPEIYIAPWKADGTLGPSLRVSTDGGSRPLWSADGARLHYAPMGEGTMKMVDVSRNPALAVSDPRPSLDLSHLKVIARSYRAIGALQGGRLLVTLPDAEEVADTRVWNVVLDWTAELKKRATR